MRQLSRWFMAGLVLLPAAVLAWNLTADLRAPVNPILVSVLAMVALYGLHRLLLLAEARGWVYYRKRQGSYGGLGVTSEFLNMYDPSRKHIQEAVRMKEWQRDEDDDGDGPKPVGQQGA